MGRLFNDGRGRLGGRTKGTPNKPQPTLNEWVEKVINRNRRVIEREIENGDEGGNLLAALIIYKGLTQGKPEPEENGIASKMNYAEFDTGNEF